MEFFFEISSLIEKRRDEKVEKKRKALPIVFAK
jgi:hypothetical protein